MTFIDFYHLSDLEKRVVCIVFRGWKMDYLKSLKFKRMEDGWMVRDEDLRATQYMRTKAKLDE